MDQEICHILGQVLLSLLLSEKPPDGYMWSGERLTKRQATSRPDHLWPELWRGMANWPVGGLDLGVGGVSYVELLIMYELWAGERLSLEKAHLRYLRPGRPISVSAVLFGPGTDIWRSCRFVGCLMRSLCLLLVGLRRFVPCSIGANHCRLRHIGWEECGHGLTSRPRESSSELFLDELLRLFRYPHRSGRALLAGTLPLRYCAARFACRTPTWRLPVSGHVTRLVADWGNSLGPAQAHVSRTARLFN